MSDRRYDAAKSALLAHRGVSVKAGEGFGSGVLTVGGHILPMRSARGDGKPFDAGRGRVMEEWLAVNER